MQPVKVMVLCGNVILLAKHSQLVSCNSDRKLLNCVLRAMFKKACLELLFNMYDSQACSFLMNW